MEKRYLGLARLKSEGEPTSFDEGVEFGNHVPRGAGQTMRDVDLKNVWLTEPRWYVVRDQFCSYDIDDEAAEVWTLSRQPGSTGWETDGGFGGYGLTYEAACELATAANKAAATDPRALQADQGGATAGSASGD